MIIIKKFSLGILLSIAVAIVGSIIAGFIPMGLISGSVLALIIGMILNPLISKTKLFKGGLDFVSKKVLKFAIILMGFSLSFSQIIKVGGYSLIVMCFTLLFAFGGGYLLGKLFKMNWKLSGLISAGTGICGGSAIAAISPTIKASDEDIAYALSSTFLFDIIMVIVFPIIGRAFGMTDLGYGLWTGTAVNDTSSVVAAGFAFSFIAGNYAIIVKLTRTLSIVPVVLIFSFINAKVEKKQRLTAACSSPINAVENISDENTLAIAKNMNVSHNTIGKESTPQVNTYCVKKKSFNLLKIFPFFIIAFLLAVAIKSTGWIPSAASDTIAQISKFFMVMALGAIGLKTNFKSVAKAGFKPMLHGFIISTLVVIVAFAVQMLLGQL